MNLAGNLQTYEVRPPRKEELGEALRLVFCKPNCPPEEARRQAETFQVVAQEQKLNLSHQWQPNRGRWGFESALKCFAAQAMLTTPRPSPFKGSKDQRGVRPSESK